MVALRNYSGHETPVSASMVNEKGIVVRSLPWAPLDLRA